MIILNMAISHNIRRLHVIINWTKVTIPTIGDLIIDDQAKKMHTC